MRSATKTRFGSSSSGSGSGPARQGKLPPQVAREAGKRVARICFRIRGLLRFEQDRWFGLPRSCSTSASSPSKPTPWPSGTGHPSYTPRQGARAERRLGSPEPSPDRKGVGTMSQEPIRPQIRPTLQLCPAWRRSQDLPCRYSYRHSGAAPRGRPTAAHRPTRTPRPCHIVPFRSTRLPPNVTRTEGLRAVAGAGRGD